MIKDSNLSCLYFEWVEIIGEYYFTAERVLNTRKYDSWTKFEENKD